MLVIKGKLTDLNSYIKALNSHRFVGSKIKKKETERIYWLAKEQGMKQAKDYPVTITFAWYSKDSRMDLDNVAFAKKFILDGLVMARVLEDDSRKYVSGFVDKFEIDKKNPRIEVVIT